MCSLNNYKEWICMFSNITMDSQYVHVMYILYNIKYITHIIFAFRLHTLHLYAIYIYISLSYQIWNYSENDLHCWSRNKMGWVCSSNTAAVFNDLPIGQTSRMSNWRKVFLSSTGGQLLDQQFHNTIMSVTISVKHSKNLRSCSMFIHKLAVIFH